MIMYHNSDIPSRLFNPRNKVLSMLKRPISAGMLPLNLFPDKDKNLSPLHFHISGGISPLI